MYEGGLSLDAQRLCFVVKTVEATSCLQVAGRGFLWGVLSSRRRFASRHATNRTGTQTWFDNVPHGHTAKLGSKHNVQPLQNLAPAM